MNDTVLKKITLISIIGILLWIGSGFVRTVSEGRRGRRTEVLQEISSSLSPKQVLGDPYLLVPTSEAYPGTKSSTVIDSEERMVYPIRSELEGTVKVETRHRGIFHAQAYELAMRSNFTFSPPKEAALLPSPNFAGGVVSAKSPRIVFPILARKGLKQLPRLKIAGWPKLLEARPCGPNVCFDLNESYAEVERNLRKAELSYEVVGMDDLAFNLLAKEAKLRLTGNWPSPSFYGSNLPTSREVHSDGFTADWSVVGAISSEEASFGVRLVETVDVYTLTDRATKYAVLFIFTVFAGFFLVEVAAKLRIHPLQYALVGAALVFFYVLVLSLAEHVAFGVAYAISAVASVALIWFYLSAALRDRAKSTFLGISLGAQYGMLYVILSAEDFALLFGALLSFGILAAIMITTRKLDWYKMDLRER